MTKYEFSPIPADVVAQLRERDDAGAARKPFVDADGGAPLRCCLTLSRVGESLLLVSYAPLRRWATVNAADPGAYDEVGPVFIHAQPCEGGTSGDFPHEYMSAARLFRAYDHRGHIMGGVRVEPSPADADAALNALFTDPEAAVVHVRAIEFGCFQTEVTRPR